MKTINVTFEDDEISMLESKKADRSWRKFIMDMVCICYHLPPIEEKNNTFPLPKGRGIQTQN